MRIVSTLDKGLDVLEAIESSGRPLTVAEIAESTGIQRTAVFRLLATLENRGYVERLPNKRYRCTSRRRRFLIGYCAPQSGSPFRDDVAAGIRDAAERANVELMALDNREDDADRAAANAQRLIDAKADLVMLFQPAEWVCHTVADQFFHAGIPVISIDVPAAGCVYFGGNNYRAGRLAGQVLARFARETWKGKFDKVVLLESTLASTNVQARLGGVLIGLKETLDGVDESKVVHLSTRADTATSREAMSAFLAQTRKGTQLLVAGFNDRAAVGAVWAARVAGREKDIAVVGQNATEEARTEIRHPDSRLIASIAYFPERYGEKLVRLALAMMSRERVPPAVYVEHMVLDHNNIDRIYARR